MALVRKTIKISKASKSDFLAFYKFFKKSLKGKLFLYSDNSINYILDAGLSKNLLKEEILNGKRPLYLAYSNSKIVGYLLTTKTYGGIAFGHWLAVDPKHQKQGAASKLLSRWQSEVPKYGTHKVWLWTTKNNIDFYKNRGFVLGGEFPDSFFGLDHYLFYKTLRKSDEKKFLGEYLKAKKKK